MLAYASRRILVALPLTWAVVTAVFLLVACLPGRPFHDLEGPGVSREATEHLRVLFGADRPLAKRYADWLGGALAGDLGVSLAYRRPVTGLLLEGIRRTAALAGVALLLQFALGTAAGVVAATSRRPAIDRAVTAGAGVLSSMPSFWIGLGLVWIFAIRLRWLPVSQMHSVGVASLVDAARHFVLPCLALALPSSGAITLYVRDRLASLRGRPFLRAALARGLGRGDAVLRHALPSTWPPVVQLLGLSLPGLVGGSVVVEVLFAWPGMGRLAYEAVLARDEPLILGCTIAGALAVIGGSLVADLLGAALDPRARGALA